MYAKTRHRVRKLFQPTDIFLQQFDIRLVYLQILLIATVWADRLYNFGVHCAKVGISWLVRNKVR